MCILINALFDAAMAFFLEMNMMYKVYIQAMEMMPLTMY